MSAKQKLVLVGNGMAGSKLLEELALNQQQGEQLFDISVFGDEPQGSYNRIMLSPVLAGEMKQDEISLLGNDWYREHGIAHHSGEAGEVLMIDRSNKSILCADGKEHRYDRLIVATGSKPVMLDIPGIDLEGVMSFRDLYDVERMIKASQEGTHAVVIGAGLLGLEAAMGLIERGMQVSVVNRASYPLNRQLDEEAAQTLQKQLEARGLNFALGAQSAALLSDDKRKVSALELCDGRKLKADLVVMAIGIRPNIELAEAAGLHCERGIVVNDTLQSFDPSVYALGECVQHRGETFGLVAPLYEQARVLANQLCEHGFAQYRSLPIATKLKVTGINVFSVGDFEGDSECDFIYYRNAGQAIYKKLVLRADKLIGAVMIGDTLDGPYYQELVENQSSIHDIRECLMFGQALCEQKLTRLYPNISAPNESSSDGSSDDSSGSSHNSKEAAA